MSAAVHYAVHTVSAVILAALINQYLQLSGELDAQRATRDRVRDTELEEKTSSHETGGRTHNVLTEGAALSALEVVSEVGSSVWCWGKSHSDRMCRFRNLCYLPAREQFVFFHADTSLLHGLPQNRFDPALLDMSSVRDHNTQYFNYVDLPVDSARHFLRKARLIERTTLVINRFHPDNLMHVVHDDLLPLYTLLRMVSKSDTQAKKLQTQSRKTFNVQLVFTEGWQPGPFADLYQLFSAHNPIYTSQIAAKDEPLCFEDAFLGLPKTTTWYQYGFHEPQGPLPNIEITGIVIRQFTAFLELRLGLDTGTSADNRYKLDRDANGGYAVLLSRKHNRLILNEMDLTIQLAQKLKMKVVNIASETHTVPEMIAIVRKASLLIGMHGSLFTLGMFLPKGAMLLELFPYAINPDHYTPYRTLAQLPGMTLTYRSWQNTKVAHTQTHPDVSWDLGGISHLPLEEQAVIKSSKKVPRHLCCRDPHWLYRIYQDTIVDIPEVLALIESGLQETRTRDFEREFDHALSSNIYPGLVEDLSCHQASSGERNPGSVEVPKLEVSWSAPVNVPYMSSAVVIQYEVWLQEAGGEDYAAWIISQTSHTFDSGLSAHTHYHVWVRCIVNNATTGPFNYRTVSCHT